MGLDMYLSARLHISGYEHSGEEKNKTYRAVLEAAGLTELASAEAPSGTVEVTVAYWRKANAIHKWFVDNVQDGEDDCDDYYVPHEKLEQLRDTCKRVLEVAQIADDQPVHSGTTWHAANPDEPEQHFQKGRALLNGEEVAKILPTQAGFFFGSTDYAEWYLQDVERTVARLDYLLAAVPEESWSLSFYYHASW